MNREKVSITEEGGCEGGSTGRLNTFLFYPLGFWNRFFFSIIYIFVYCNKRFNQPKGVVTFIQLSLCGVRLIDTL